MNIISCVVRKLAERSLGLLTDIFKKNINKPRVDYELRSAHGRAVENKPRVDYELRSAHGHAVEKKKTLRVD